MNEQSLAIAAAVACALTWAGFDALRKRLVAHVAPLPLTCALALAQTPLYAVWAFSEGPTAVTAAYIGPGIAVWAVNLVANLLFFESLRRADLSATVPMLALTPVFASALAWVWLDEALAPVEMLGIALVVSGAIAMNISGQGTQDPGTVVKQRLASLLMSLVALLWAATTVFDKVSLQHTSIAMHAVIQSAALGASLLVWLVAFGQLGKLRPVATVRWSFLVGSIAAAVALALQFYAVLGAPVGIVEAIKRAIGAMSALALGWLLFKERFSRRRVLAVCAMACGVCLVVV